MPATVEKVSGGEDDHPSVAQVGPDNDIKEIGLSNTTLVRPGNVPKMHLLLEGAHYSLVVPRTGMTEKHAVHPEPEESDKGYEAEGDEEDEEGEVTTTIKSAEDKLRDLQNEFEALKAMYVKVVKENKKLKAKTTVVNTDNPATSDKESDTTDEETLSSSKSKGFKRTTPQNQSEKKLYCTICKVSFRKENDLKSHMTSHNKDGDWTCEDCSFQTNSEDKLRDHKIRAHKPQNSPSINQSNEGLQVTEEHKTSKSGGSTCNLCNKDFIYRIDLSKHISDEHKTYKQCRNLGSCSHPRCRYNHKEYPPGTQICYECGKTFKTIHQLMKHRKAEHKVQLCKEFLKGNCGYSQEDCYFAHAKQASTGPVIIVEKKTQHSKSQPEGFWDAPSNLAPPATNQKPSEQGPTQLEWIQMKQTLHMMNKMMSKFM